jgi:hypothetical protein
MTFAVKDRIGETSTTTGTGTLTLAGAQTGFQALSTIGANNACTYFLTDGTNWEVGIGTYLAAPSRLQRDTILASSNGGSAVNWGGTTINVYVGLPADGIKPTRRKSKSVAGSANVTLTQDEMRCEVLELTGVLTGSIDVIVDATVWSWPVIYNNTTGAFTVTVKVSGQTGVKVPQKRALSLHNNGTDVLRPGDAAAVESRTANTILGAGDHGKTIRVTSGTFSQTFDAVATLGDGWWVNYINEGTGTVTFDPNSSETIDGLATIVFGPGESGYIVCNGSNLKVMNRSRYAGAIGAGRNIVCSRPSASTIDIDADEVQLKDANGNVFVATSVNLTADITASGANGLDTGAEASGTWYYGWVIYNPASNTVASLLSVSATAPTMPSGYTFKALVTAARNDGSSNFLAYNQKGKWIYFDAQQSVGGGLSATAETAITISGFVPPIAQEFKLEGGTRTAFSAGAVSDDTLNFRVVTGINATNFRSFATAGGEPFTSQYEYTFPNLSQTLYYIWTRGSSGGTGPTIYNAQIRGFSLPMGGE